MAGCGEPYKARGSVAWLGTTRPTPPRYPDAHREAPNVEDAQPRTLREAALAHGLTVAAEHNIELALLQPTKFEFADTPLSDVIDFLAAQFDINIQLDNKGLADAAVDPSAPITRTIRNPVSLEASLRLILDDLDLAFVIQDEMLKITSKEKADEILTTKVYLVGDLLNRRSDRQVVRPVSGIRINPLVIAIIEAVQPDSWGDNGGPGSISRVGDVFVISQKRDCHVQISALLAQFALICPPWTMALFGDHHVHRSCAPSRMLSKQSWVKTPLKPFRSSSRLKVGATMAARAWYASSRHEKMTETRRRSVYRGRCW